MGGFGGAGFGGSGFGGGCFTGNWAFIIFLIFILILWGWGAWC